MRPRIVAVHEVNNGLFTSRVLAKKVTTSGSRESIERAFRRRMKINRQAVQMAMA
jgi:hypothetical protein